MSNSFNNDSFEKSPDPPMLSIEIQLTETESANLIINNDDIIEEKVVAFCKEYNLPEEVKVMISEQVMAQLENQINELEDSINEAQKEEEEDDDNQAPQPHDGEEEQIKFKKKPIPYNKKKANKQKGPTKGEELFSRFMEQKPKKEEARKRAKQEQLNEELKEAVFKPTINKRSQKLSARQSNEKIEDRLLGNALLSKEKKMKEVNKKTIEDNEQLPYRPTLPEKSKVIGDIKRKIRADEIPQNISGINPAYLSTSRNKSVDISFSTSLDNIRKDRLTDRSEGNISSMNNNTQSHIVSKSRSKDCLRQRNNSHLLNDLSKSSLSIDKKSRMTNNHSTVNKTSMIFHKKIPIPQLNPENNIHDFLYVEAKLIEARKAKEAEEKMKEICPFTPYIPQTVRDLVIRRETQGECIKRLHKTKIQNEEIQIYKSTNIDSKTGKPLFKPTITRGPKNESARNVSVNLDSLYDKKLLKNKDEIHQKEICNVLEKKKIFLERSMEIILKMKYEKYKEIFNLLDSDCDGLISSKNIKLSSLDQDVLEALTPLLDELQASQENMAFKEFCLKADKELAVKIFSNH